MRLYFILILSILLNLSTFAQSDDNDCHFEVSKKSQKLFKKAMEDLQYGHFTEGSNKLEECIDDSPEFLRAIWVQASLNSKKTNRYRKEEIAINSYKRIIELCPSYKNYYAYYYLGKMYFEAENWDEAHTMLEAFLNADTDKIHENNYEDALDLSKYAKFYAKIYNDPVPFDPHIVEDVSTLDDEYLPSLSPDNDYLYFTRRFQAKTNQRVRSYSTGREEKFCKSKRTALNRFAIGKTMESPFNEQSNEGGATLTIDNRELYYTRCKIKADKTLNCDICYASLDADGYWSDIKVLGSNINTPDYWESMPSISSDGNTLYFVSNRPGGMGGYDIYRSTKDNKGQWTKAINMGPSINTAGNEKSPFIHTDSQTLYFSSADRHDNKTGEYYAGHMGLGGYDIFYTRLNDSNLWIAPKNIGYPINSENNDLGFFVSTNGEYGYFASNKLESSGKEASKKDPWNIYSFKLYKKARPQKVLFVKGSLKDEKTNEVVRDAKIVIKNVETKEVKEIPVDNETGNYVFTMVMKADYTMTVKKRDYTYITKYIAKDDTKFNVPVNIDMELKQIEVGKTYNLEDIYFATDSDKLTETSKKVVEGFFDFLHDNPNVIIEIQGHTDNIGADDYNMQLSKNRARTVYNLLLKLGIPARQMKYKGYGETMPIADNQTEEGRALNRRTVFLIISK
jgi:outer membrane protein OmpA-like peptidoglycan-associated protein